MEQIQPFEIIVTDYAGPLYCTSKGKKDLKAYILLFSCSITKAVHPGLMSNLTTTEFIKSFKKSRRGKRNIIYSDNAKTLKTGEKLLNSISRCEKFHDFFQ